jgi:hypothetical protein
MDGGGYVLAGVADGIHHQRDSGDGDFALVLYAALGDGAAESGDGGVLLSVFAVGVGWGALCGLGGGDDSFGCGLGGDISCDRSDGVDLGDSWDAEFIGVVVGDIDFSPGGACGDAMWVRAIGGGCGGDRVAGGSGLRDGAWIVSRGCRVVSADDYEFMAMMRMLPGSRE